MQTLDIVNLIEKNPITKLTNVYNNKLLTKIKENFTEAEQQLFITSFYCYLNYHSTNDFVIDLDNVWNWLGFSTKQKAKILLEKNFTINIDYKFLLNQQVKQNIYNDLNIKKSGSGGYNKEFFMLTIKTFKLFCIKADTQKAKEIHEYFVKLEEILHETMEEESNELKMQLQNIQEKNKEEFNEKIKREREKILLKEFGSSGPLIYIIKVKSFDTGEYIIKIGESRIGVQARYNEHKSNYDEILLLDCFSVIKCKEFESFLHSHDSIRFNRVSDLEGHENERELFLVGKKLSYEMILKIIQSNIKKFNEYNNDDFEKLQLELNIYKAVSENNTMTQSTTQPINSEIKELLENQKGILENQRKILEKIENLENSNKEILQKISITQIKTTTNFNEPLTTLGPRLQQVNPETLLLVKVYESVSECIKMNHFTLKRPSIDKAVKENTIYHGFRWLYVDRDEDSSIIKSILPTKQTKIQNLDYVAKVNKERTEILNLYLDRKTASRYNNYESSSALDNVVKNETIKDGYYYLLYHKCSETLRNNFMEKHGEPILYKNGIGQYDSQNNLVQEFVCKQYCVKTLNISDKSLSKALNKNMMYNNFYYKYIGIKDKY